MWDMVLEHLPSVIGAVAVGLAIALAWGIRKIGLEKKFEDAVIDFVKRGIDKAKEELQTATDPASPGGAKITSEEMSALRQKIFDYVKGEVKGPLAKIALQWGENRIKGFIGDRLAERGITVGAS